MLKQAKHDVCECAGFYDVFTVKDAIHWIGGKPQVIRDAIRELVKEGMLKRVDRGIYKWN